MGDFIVIGVVFAIVAIGVIYSVKHFKGEGGCCGGGTYKPKRKKLSRVISQKTFKIDGMHCEQCKNRVEKALNDIEGVAGRVNLKKGEATVSYAQEVPDGIIREKLQKAGYTVL